MRRAFTMLEFLAIVAITAVLAAVLFPVFANARRSSQIQSTLARLHQVHTAMMIYQAEYGGVGVYGSPAEMGLPSIELIDRSRFGLPVEAWQSACSSAVPHNPGGVEFEYGVENTPAFIEDAQRFQDNLIVVDDLGCNDAGTPLYSNYLPHRGLGVLLGGALVNRFATGRSGDTAWWAPPLQK